jgi:DNA-binding response OmpR family regulator
VLVVEDTPICREPLISALKLKGFEAGGAEDGEKALKLIAEKLPDLVLLDIMMPVVDGWEVLRKLREDPKTAKLPVILLTATADRDWVARAAKLGVREYLLKGQFSMTELFTRVEKCLRIPAKSGGPKAATLVSAMPHTQAPAPTPATSTPPATPTPSDSGAVVMAKVEAEVLTQAIALATSLLESVESLVALVTKHPKLADQVVAAADSKSFVASANPPDPKLEAAARGIAHQTMRSIAGIGR